MRGREWWRLSRKFCVVERQGRATRREILAPRTAFLIAVVAFLLLLVELLLLVAKVSCRLWSGGIHSTALMDAQRKDVQTPARSWQGR